MRDVIRDELDLNPTRRSEIPARSIADHMGLAYGAYAPADQALGDEPGKINPDIQDDWFDKLSAQKVPEGYEAAFKRWKDSMEDDFSLGMRGQTVSRLLLGHGLPSPVDVGLRVHHTWGVPVIPGSAVKGLLSQYLETIYGPSEPTHHPHDENHPEPDRAPYQGVVWDGKTIEFGPGEVYRALFGAPDAKTDDEYTDSPVGAQKGCVTFHDAWMVPPNDSSDPAYAPFARDVLTVHQKTYYNADGRDEWPTDHDEPNPVSFLTVRPGTRFFFGLSGDPEWTHFASKLLSRALAEWGIGGKTTSGYGQFDRDAWRIDPNPNDMLAEESEWASRVSDWFDEHPTDGDLSTNDRLDLFDEHFSDEILSSELPTHQRHGIWLVLDERLNKDQRTKEFRKRWYDLLEDGKIDVQAWDLTLGDPGFPVQTDDEIALEVGHWLEDWLTDRELLETECWAQETVNSLIESFFETFSDTLMGAQELNDEEIRTVVSYFLPDDDSVKPFWQDWLDPMLD